MLDFLKNHPFAVEAFFERSIVVTFAVPKEEVAALIPECLKPDAFNDRWAFIAVAMVSTRKLRPKGWPGWMGNDFFLIGYRAFVRYTSHSGKNLRGLYILKSETNKRKMQIAGNIFTHYDYTTTDITERPTSGTIHISSQQSGFNVELSHAPTEDIFLPPSSPFATWKEARRFAGPLPFTFTYNPANQKVLIIEGVRQYWQPFPVKVLNYNFEFLKQLNVSTPVLASAFMVENIPYYWKKGKTEKWIGH